MLAKLYGKWMYRWEEALTTRDTNRIVRPVEWGFDWLQDFAQAHHTPGDDAAEERAMLQLNDFILQHRDQFFAYETPSDFVLEERHPQLFPTNVRPETIARTSYFAGKQPKERWPKRSFSVLLRPYGRLTRRTTG